jgi:hypothetical protein
MSRFSEITNAAGKLISLVLAVEEAEGREANLNMTVSVGRDGKREDWTVIVKRAAKKKCKSTG